MQFRRLEAMKSLLGIFICLAVADCHALANNSNRSTPPRFQSTPRPNSTEDLLPEQMTVNLKMPNCTMKLNLTKNLNIPSDVPVIIANNGTYSNWTQNSNQFAVYFGKTTNASVVVEIKKDNGKTVKICRGILSIDGIFYSVYPRNGSYYDNDTEAIVVQIDGVEHVMREENSTLNFDDFLNTTTVRRPDPKAMFGDQAYGWPSGFQRYVVEICVFIDYALYYKWYSRSQAYDYWGRYYDAVINLQYYFVQVANGVDMRYSSIKQSDFSINVRLVGIYIAATPSDSIWTERSDVKLYYGPDTYVHMYKALQLFEQWLPNNIPRFGFAFDQATMFTGYNMYDGYFCSGAPCSKSGVADIGSICQLGAPLATSAAMCKDAGPYAATNTWAHELGHNLGCQHDGTGNGCSSSDQFIMAVSPTDLTPYNFNNPFTFSTCSIWYFRNTLAQITMSGNGNCLLFGSSAPTVVVPPNFAAYPGMQYSADQQCQNIYGSGSYYCGGGSRDKSICRVMECWIPSRRACFAAVEQRAADGTKCGNKFWCMNGQCVYDSRAAPAPDSCIYGDYKDQVDTGTGYKLTCYDIGRLQPYNCYDNRTNVECCQTCATIRDTTKPASCGYGDKDPNFCRLITKRWYCYESDIADTCCDFCYKQKANVFGCEYGDHSDWCSTSESYVCYGSNNECCETCQKYYNGDCAGCEFGDKANWCSYFVTGPADCLRPEISSVCCQRCAAYKTTNVLTDNASWCSSIFAGQCYDPQTASTCMSTCCSYRRSNFNCVYGNRYSWCRKEYCSAYRNDCCEVCS